MRIVKGKLNGDFHRKSNLIFDVAMQAGFSAPKNAVLSSNYPKQHQIAYGERYLWA